MPRWDIFCAVVDNYGDIGVCWRLARQLATEYGVASAGERGIGVRLWVDDLHRFAGLCPAVSVEQDEQWVEGVQIRLWPTDFPAVEAADVVIEAFACELPERYVQSMVERSQSRAASSPVWINLEYLSAEKWVEGCHLLTSPGRASGLTKHFFFPGFTPRTGGVLRERDLLADRSAFGQSEVDALLRTWGLPAPDEPALRVSLFCYDNPALLELLRCWAEGAEQVQCLAAPGAATELIARWFGAELKPGAAMRKNSLTALALPFLPQPSYDRLLWSCDVNFVRGEDSFVRAQWAQQPFVWQIYPQTEDAHHVKLEAFLTRYAAGFPHADAIRNLWHVWNGVGPTSPADIRSAWREFVAHRESVRQHGAAWAVRLDRAGHLADNLIRFLNSLL